MDFDYNDWDDRLCTLFQGSSNRNTEEYSQAWMSLLNEICVSQMQKAMDDDTTAFKLMARCSLMCNISLRPYQIPRLPKHFRPMLTLWKKWKISPIDAGGLEEIVTKDPPEPWPFISSLSPKLAEISKRLGNPLFPVGALVKAIPSLNCHCLLRKHSEYVGVNGKRGSLLMFERREDCCRARHTGGFIVVYDDTEVTLDDGSSYLGLRRVN